MHPQPGQPSSQQPGSVVVPSPAAAGQPTVAPLGNPEALSGLGLEALEAGMAAGGVEALIGIDEVQKALNRSRASVYRYTNTDPRQLNPPFNPRKLNPEYRSDQKEPLLFHPNEVARFARDVLRIKEVTVEVLNAPSTATQQLLSAILEEIRAIRLRLEGLEDPPANLAAHRSQSQSRPAA